MWQSSKIRVYFLVFFLLFYPKILYSNIDGFQDIEKNSKSYYKLEIPDKIKINIIGKEYIRYLKQIRNVGRKDNLTNAQTNFALKEWIKASISSENNDDIKVKLIIHGDFNDHISIPYSSLRVSAKNEFFNQLKQFILFRPQTRRYEGEVFGTLFFKKIGIISPYTKYIKVQINENDFFTYIFQEKINKYLLERNGLREDPIIEYDEKNKWNKYTQNIGTGNSLDFYKLENSNYVKKDFGIDKIFKSVTLKQIIRSDSNLDNNLFESSMLIFGACHGLADHNRKYYFDSLNNKFLPIYYDGMFFYDKTNNLCENERNDQKFFYSKEIFNYLSNFLNNESFKKELENEFYYLIQRQDLDLFEYYWSYISKNLKKYKKLIKKNEIQKDNDIDKNIYNKVNVFEKLRLLELPYPTVFYYKDIKNNKFKLCFEWFDLKENVYLISSEEEYIYKKGQGCRNIKKNELVDLIKNDIFFKTNLDKKIRIYPILVGNIVNNHLSFDTKDLVLKKIELENIKNLSEIVLQPKTILEIKIKENSNIDNLNFLSSELNNSAVILRGKNFKINKVSFEENNKKQLNSAIQGKNITGCLNILNSEFIINELIINGSNCEDGINIVKSKGKINDLKIKNVISDGIDLDYSKVNIKKINVSDATGDCIDLSFGDYFIENAKVNECGDKGLSVGEKSKIFINKIDVNNSEIGIASKDSSLTKLKEASFKNAKTCLAAYNKKKEFYGGVIEIEKMNCKNFVKKIDFDKSSIIKEGIKVNQ